MIRAVFDSNVLVSGIIGIDRPSSTPGQLLRVWEDRAFTIVLSDYILDEVQRKLSKPYFSRRVPSSTSALSIQNLRARAELVVISDIVVGVAAHSEDDPILATAISGRVPFLVTGDAELIALGAYQDVLIISPSRFSLLLLPGGSARR